MKYYLKEPYRVIGFSDDPFCLLNTDTGERKHLSPTDFVLLKECGTGFELNKSDADYTEDKKRLEEWWDRGVVGEKKENRSPFEYEYNEFAGRTSIQLAITSKCNYHCLHCLAAEGSENGSEELSLQFCDRVLREASECQIKNVLLTGGEPLIHPDFLKIVKKISEHGLRLTQILTNGSLITEKLLEGIKALGQKPDFTISFDGIGTHDWMRNTEGAEEAALKSFKMVKEKGFKTRANINVNDVTLTRITETCRMLVKDYGVSALHMILTSPEPRWEEMGGCNHTLPFGTYFDSMTELIRISKLEKWNVFLDVFLMPSLHNLENPSFDLYENPSAPTGREKLMDFCPKAKTTVFVGHDGRVLPCSAYEGVTNARGLMQGRDINLYYHSLKEILSSSSYLDPFNATISELQNNAEHCKDCMWVRLCRGGCRVFSMYYCDSETCHNNACGANCIFYRGGYVEKYINMLKTLEWGFSRNN